MSFLYTVYKNLNIAYNKTWTSPPVWPFWEEPFWQQIVGTTWIDCEYESNNKMKDLEKGVKQMELAFEARVTSLADQFKTSKTVPDQQLPAGQSSQTSTVQATAKYKEFRVIGSIGERGQKDTLSFSSLVRHIAHGVQRGYRDEEVIAAAMSAILPGMKLQSYLKGKSELTLPQLRRIL